MLRAAFRSFILLLLVTFSLGGCGSRVDNSRVHLAPPTESTTLGAGDMFTMQIIGESWPTDYQIAPDGFVNLPYIHRLHVEGLEPQELSELVRQKLIELKYLTDPSVLIRVKEYNSKHILLIGQISRVGSYPYTPGLTLMRAISQAGGFTAIAKKDHVNLTRRTKTGTRTVILSVDAIMEGHSPDVPLQPGDRIYVQERIF